MLSIHEIHHEYKQASYPVAAAWTWGWRLPTLMAAKTSSPASAFTKVLRSFETGGFTYRDVVAELKRLLKAGASPTEMSEILRRREFIEPLPVDAHREVLGLLDDLHDSGRTIVLLGNAVREAFSRALGGSLPPVLIHPQTVGGCTWRQIPHPSGRNLYYNAEANRKVVELLMEELYVEYRNQAT